MCYLVQQRSITLGGGAKSQARKKFESIIYNAVNKHVGKTLILPYTDSIYIDYDVYQKMFNAPLKIVAYVDGECSICLFYVTFWKDFIYELQNQGHEIQVIIYANSFYEDNLRNYMASHWDYPWLYDHDKAFVFRNTLYDTRFQTVLVNGNNTILLIGNPYFNEKLKSLYLKTIKDY